jgi:ubiquinone/menaquinone biosynthesis C-methylase UbiE
MSPAQSKANLLRLTAHYAPNYDVTYDSDQFFASKAYREFEHTIVDSLVQGIYSGARDVFVDLGCATGITTLHAVPSFNKLYGFDISEDMIRFANRKLANQPSDKIQFRQADLESGIPLPTHSVSLLVMGFGTGSDVRNLPALLLEIQRVLIRSGRFLLSFYNREALVYSWHHLPWATSIPAKLDLERNCLQVPLDGDDTIEVYARAYTAEEIRALMPDRLTIETQVTYPSIGAILPTDAFKDRAAAHAILALDEKLSSSRHGAYRIVTGKRSLFD